MALEGYLPDDDDEDDAVAGSFPASDPVSTHVPNGAGHEPHGAPAARRSPSAGAPARR